MEEPSYCTADRLAKLVDHRTTVREVVGSNPGLWDVKEPTHQSQRVGHGVPGVLVWSGLVWSLGWGVGEGTSHGPMSSVRADPRWAGLCPDLHSHFYFFPLLVAGHAGLT